MSLLDDTIARIEPLSSEHVDAARERHGQLTKPPGSLGPLEDLGCALSGMYAVCPPPQPDRVAIAVFAADHGVHAQGVTPWPQEVTAQMVGNFLAGGAVINALARALDAHVTVVDVGVASDLPDAPGLVHRKVAYGTADLAVGPALTREQARQAVEVGISVATELAAGHQLLVAGDMGIANTTPSAALVAVFTGAPARSVTGRGTGIDDATYARKVAAIERALTERSISPADPLNVLAEVGGLEHCALAGFLIGAAASRTPVVLDGVIVCSAALAAQRLAPGAAAYWIAGHRSAEPGAGAALAALGLLPLVALDLHLGEGSGAALAVPLVQAAARVLREVATFDSAGVTDGTATPVPD